MLNFTKVGISACVALAIVMLIICEFWRLFLVGDEGAELRNGFFAWSKLSSSSWLGVLWWWWWWNWKSNIRIPEAEFRTHCL